MFFAKNTQINQSFGIIFEIIQPSKVVKQHTELEHTPFFNLYQQAILMGFLSYLGWLIRGISESPHKLTHHPLGISSFA